MRASVLIAIPCFGGIVSAKTAIGMTELTKILQGRINYDFLMVSNQSLISKGRSDIANYFMNATTYEYIFWIDSDIGFSGKDFIRLYELQEQHVMGTYRHKTQNIRYSFELDVDNGKPVWHNSNKAIKILQNVGGFSLIHRSVFEQIQPNISHLKYIPDSNSRNITEEEKNNSYHYYQTPIHNGQILPEDFAFQRKCNEAGIDMWLRPDIVLTHNGNTDFTNDDLETQLRRL